MKLSTPRWWYSRTPPPAWARLVLAPAARLFATLTARRLRTTVPVRVGAFVISVGNLTVGGAGKTPVARELARLLSAQGVAVSVLSRGYGGSEPGPLRVDPQRHTAAEVGDEPLMLSADLPVIIARDRVAGAEAAVKAGARVVVLDDAHQNPALVKDLSIIVVDGESRDGEWPFGHGDICPLGPLREPFAVGLARADLVVVVLPVGLDTLDDTLRQALSAKPIAVARLHPNRPANDQPVLGFAGVAKPWKVERALRAAGWPLVGFHAFADHRPYGARELKALQAEAAKGGAILATTEKDLARLPPAFRDQVEVFTIALRFDDEAQVLAAVKGALSSS